MQCTTHISQSANNVKLTSNIALCPTSGPKKVVESIIGADTGGGRPQNLTKKEKNVARTQHVFVVKVPGHLSEILYLPLLLVD